MEIASHSRDPDIAVTVVSCPPSVWTQLVVKDLNVYSAAVIVIIVIAVIIVIIIVITIIFVITVISVVSALGVSSALESHARC